MLRWLRGTLSGFLWVNIRLLPYLNYDHSPDSQADEQLELALFAKVPWRGVDGIDVVAH